LTLRVFAVLDRKDLEGEKTKRKKLVPLSALKPHSPPFKKTKVEHQKKVSKEKHFKVERGKAKLEEAVRTLTDQEVLPSSKNLVVVKAAKPERKISKCSSFRSCCCLWKWNSWGEGFCW